MSVLKCPECNGRGHVSAHSGWPGAKKTCPSCGGNPKPVPTRKRDPELWNLVNRILEHEGRGLWLIGEAESNMAAARQEAGLAAELTRQLEKLTKGQE